MTKEQLDTIKPLKFDYEYTKEEAGLIYIPYKRKIGDIRVLKFNGEEITFKNVSPLYGTLISGFPFKKVFRKGTTFKKLYLLK